MSALMKFAAASTLLFVAGCQWTMPQTIVGTATEEALCVAWRDSLPTRSRQDTEQTQAEIGNAYDVYAAACPAWPANLTR